MAGKPNNPVRGFEWRLLPELSDLLNRLGHHGFRQWPDSPAAVRTELETARTDPEQDVFVVHCIGGTDGLCGCAVMVPETDIDHVVVSLGLLEQCKLQAGPLLDAVIGRAKSLSVSQVHVAVRNTSVEPVDVLREHGFEHIRSTLELTLSRADAGGIQDVPIPEGFTLRPMKSSAETLRLTRLQNTVFEEHWGFSQNTTEEIQAKLDLDITGTEHVLLAESADGEIAGYIWTAIEWGENGSAGKIWMTGVMPEYRGAGLGSAIVVAGIKHLLAEGVASLDLEVIEDNAAAVAIYTGAGFRESGRTDWYELKV